MTGSILVADSHRLLSDALVRALRHQDFDVIGEFPTSGQEVLASVSRSKPTVVLLDYWIPGMEGPAISRLILSMRPECKVIFLSWLHGRDQIREALKAGAVGFLPKSINVDQLSEAIRSALEGHALVYGEELQDLIGTIGERESQDEEVWQRLALLSVREIEILRRLDEGRLIEQVARDLAIKPSTVRNHIHNILEKIGAQTHTQALAIARHHGLIRRP